MSSARCGVNESKRRGTNCTPSSAVNLFPSLPPGSPLIGSRITLHRLTKRSPAVDCRRALVRIAAYLPESETYIIQRLREECSHRPVEKHDFHTENGPYESQVKLGGKLRRYESFNELCLVRVCIGQSRISFTTVICTMIYYFLVKGMKRKKAIR